MAGMTGDTIRMQQAATQVDQAAQVITGLRNQIRGHHAALANGWKSGASMSYQQVAEQWDVHLGIILGNLDAIHVGLTGTGVNYGTNDDDQRLLANQLGSLLNPA